MAGKMDEGFRWTKELKEWLRECYPSRPTREMAAESGIEAHRIMVKANTLGIKKNKDVKSAAISAGTRNSIKNDRRRRRIGLRGHMIMSALTKMNDAQYRVRAHMKKRGYGLGDLNTEEKRFQIFYDRNTERDGRLEKRAHKYGFVVIRKITD